METIRKYRTLFQQAVRPDEAPKDMVGRELLGEATKISAVSIQKYEQGVMKPSVAAAFQMASVIGETINKKPSEILWEICEEYAKP